MIKIARKSDAPRPLPLRVKRRREKAAKIAAAIFAAFLLFLVAAFLSNLPSVRIASVEIEGVSAIPNEGLNQVISEELDGKYLGLFSKSNILLYPRKELLAKVESAFKRIKSADFHMKNLTTVILSVEERKPAGFWCHSRGSDPLFSKNCYFLDESGFIFAPAPDFFGTTYLKFYGGPESFGQINLFLSKLSLFKVKPIELSVSGDGDYEIAIEGGGRIIVNPAKDLAVALENLRVLLTQSELSKNQDFPLALDYIDLRYGNKVFYKLRE